MPEPIIKKASLREQVVEAVKRDLQEGVISPGERVTEDALVQRLNVSRTPIREALSQLAHLGLLQQRTGGGYVVPFPTPAELRDVIKVRKLLEPAAVRIAAEEFGPEEIDRVTRAIEREAAACEVKSSSRFAAANEEFRTSIFQHISNKALRAAIAQFNPHLHLIRAATLSDVDLRKDIVGRQLEVRDAIRAHDGDRSEEHTSELQSLMRISDAVFCLKKQKNTT